MDFLDLQNKLYTSAEQSQCCRFFRLENKLFDAAQQAGKEGAQQHFIITRTTAMLVKKIVRNNNIGFKGYYHQFDFLFTCTLLS